MPSRKLERVTLLPFNSLSFLISRITLSRVES